MDLDPSSFKNSDQRTNRGEHRYIAKDLGHDKSYKCTFCKRGFSNAQALGGHMNVHRKDRARLREFSCENLLSLEINRSITDGGDSPPTELSSSTSHKPSSPSGTDAKENPCLPYKDDDSRVITEEDPLREHLPLFSEEPSVSEVGEKHGAGDFGKVHVEEELGSSRAVSLVEVDLELRLGP